MISVVYDTLVQGVTIISRLCHVVGASISFLDKCWSGAGSDEIFELHNHELAEGSPRFTIGEFLCVPTLEGFGVHVIRIVELDDGV